MKKLYFLLISLLILNLSHAQSEFLVTLDPSTGFYTKIDSLPDVRFVCVSAHLTTFDEINQRFIFNGKDSNGDSRLYSIDANSGNIVSNPIFPVLSDTLDNIIELQFDNTSNKLYGLHWDNSEDREYFISIDLSTGIHTIIDSIPDLKLVAGNATFDKINHRYIFRGKDSAAMDYIYSIDAITGSVISNPLFPVLLNPYDNIVQFQFDNSSNTLYALYYEGFGNRFHLVSLNPSNGQYSIIDSLPGIIGVTSVPHFTTFDEINQRYIFKGTDTNFIKHLYSVDATNGNIISNPIFPILSDTLDNIIELQFDNSSGILYALHWDNNIVTGKESEKIKNVINIYPNPTTGLITITNGELKIKNVRVFDIYGKEVLSQISNFKSQNTSIDLSTQPKGIYIIKAQTNKGVAIEKVILN